MGASDGFGKRHDSLIDRDKITTPVSGKRFRRQENERQVLIDGQMRGVTVGIRIVSVS